VAGAGGSEAERQRADHKMQQVLWIVRVNDVEQRVDESDRREIQHRNQQEHHTEQRISHITVAA
jgi:hypothetical protein